MKQYLFLSALACVFVSSILIIFLYTKPKTTKLVPPIIPTIAPIQWQTYKNEKYGFEFEIPSDWTVTHPTPDHLNLNKNGHVYSDEGSSLESAISIYISSNDSNKSFSQLLKDLEKSLYGGTIEKIKISGIDAAIKINYLGTQIYLLTDKSEIVFAMSKTVPQTEVFRHILSTFKFLPDTTTWKTFKDSSYDFVFQYPTHYQAKTYTNDKEYETSIVLFDKQNLMKNPDSQALVPPNTIRVIKTHLLEKYCPPVSCQQTTVKIGNNTFIKFKYGIGGNYFYSPGILFYSYFDNIDETDSEFSQILSSFKFTSYNSTWKTYKNTQYGFEFRYPSSFKIRVDSPQGERLWRIYVDNPANEDEITLFDITQTKDYTYSSDYFSPKKEINIGKNQFITYEATEGGMMPIYIFEINNLRINSYFDNKNLTNPLFSQILSTFKLTQ